MLAGAIAVFAGPTMLGLGKEVVGGLTTAASFGLIGGSLFGMIAVDDNGPSDIPVDLSLANDAKNEIKELKAKIKEINKKPVMGKR